MTRDHEVLVRARNVLAERGWTQGTRNASWDGGPTCVGIALQCGGICGLDDDDMALDRIQRLVAGDLDVVTWNDDPQRTEHEVFATLDRAIAATAPEPDTEFLNNVAEPVAA